MSSLRIQGWKIYLYNALLVVLLISASSGAKAQLNFAQSENSAIGSLSPTSLKPGDFDSDGDLDLLVQYYDVPATKWKAQIFENTSVVNSISFSATTHIFEGAGDFIDWTDFNMDGQLDVFVNGSGTSSIYLRSGTGYSKYTGSITGTSTFKHFEIVDQNNDTQLDVTSDKVFLDYDKDGDLDYFNEELFTNRDSYFQKTHTFIDGGSTIFSYKRVPAIVNDFDNNGYLDIAYIEHDGKNSILEAYVLLNNNKVFTKLGVSSYESYNGGLYLSTTADFNSNGFPELVLYSAPDGFGGGQGSVTFIEIKNGAYQEIHTLVTPANTFERDIPASCSGDFDGDGKVDLIIFYRYLYYDINGNDIPDQKLLLYRNTLSQSNTYATAPPGLTSRVQNDVVTLSWTPSTDDHTVSGGITYNLAIKNGVDQVLMDNRTAGGNLKINKLGNVNQATEVSLHLPNGQYTWSVSAVDGQCIKSTRSTEGSFEVLQSTNSAKNLSLNNVAFTKTVEDRIILTGDDAGSIYFQTIESNFGSKINLPAKINTTTTSCSEPRISYNGVGEQFMVIWRGSTATQSNKLWGRVFDKNGVPLTAEFLISDDEASGLSVEKYDVCYNKARNNYRVAWAHSGTGGPGIRTTTVNASNFTKGPIAHFKDYNDFPSIVINYFNEMLLGASPDGNSITMVYASVGYEMFGVLSDGRYVYVELLDADFVSKAPQTVIVDAIPRSICYNTLSSTFGIGWDKFKYRKDPNSASAIIRNSEVQAGLLHATDGSPLQIVDGLSSSFIQGGSGGALYASLVYNSIRNEYLMTWYNTEDKLVHGRRISPITKSPIESEEFLVSNFSGDKTRAAFIPERNQFALSFGNQFSMFTLTKDKAPEVTSVSLNKASVDTPIIITGTGFGNTPIINKVYFGTIPAVVDPVFPVASDPTKIRVTVPPGLGRLTVPVTVIFDGQTSNSTIVFENLDNTSVTLVTPLVGTPGETITITGVNFPTQADQVQVMFGSVPSAPTDIVGTPTTTSIKVKVPEAAIRGKDQSIGVVIQGVLNNYPVGRFRVIRVPVIESVKALSSSNDFISGTDVLIKGKDFSDKSDDLVVKIGNFIVHPDSIAPGNSTLNFPVPFGAEGKALKFSVYVDDTVGRSAEYKVILGSEIKRMITRPEEFVFTNGTDDKIDWSMEVYSDVSVKEITFWTKGISEEDSELKSQPLSGLKDNKIEHHTTEAEFTDDPIGLEAFYEVIDKSDSIRRSERFKVYRNYESADESNFIPELRFGGNVADYQIVSIPYTLVLNNIPLVFKDLFNPYGYDKSKWRIMHYEPTQSKYLEYLDGLNVIEPGKGYWLISRNAHDIFFEGATTLEVSDEGYYKIPLKKGWNQIGNPFNFNVSWDDIMAANGNLTDIEPFKTFKDGAFETVTTIEKFRGGFVRYNGSSDDSLKIPARQNKTVNGGRVKTKNAFVNDLGGKEWRIGLDFIAGDLKNRLASFGMHPNSLDGEDARDEHRLPPFIQTLDVVFPSSLSTSIVATNDHYTWSFEVSNTTGQTEVTLTWNNALFGDNDRELFLHDKSEERMINMREQNHYTFVYREGYAFNIHFGDMTYIEEISRPENVVLSDAYPNPMRSVTTIPFTIVEDETHVELTIFDLQGREIQKLVNGKLPPGFYEFDWDGKSTSGEAASSGVVMYRLQATSPSSGVRSLVKRLVVSR